MFDTKNRYLQIAFNNDMREVYRLISHIPRSDRIFLEAGTPYIKKEGMNGITYLRQVWPGHIIADLKVSDGALKEVELAYKAGATGATVLGSAPKETIELFIKACEHFKMISMIDMLGITEVLPILRTLSFKPDVIVLHRGRDEELNSDNAIPYKQINKIKSKYDCLISAAGGIDLHEARSAIFNGANIVVANIVSSKDPWVGFSSDKTIGDLARKFLTEIR